MLHFCSFWWVKFKIRFGLDFDRSANKKKFERILLVAQKLHDKNPRALPDFVNILLKPLQAELNLELAENKVVSSRGFNETLLFGDFIKGYVGDVNHSFAEVFPPEDYCVRLGYHIILPLPWHLHGYVDNLCDLGESKTPKSPMPWEQRVGHYVSVWLPWGFVLVGTGNHSIFAGIASSEGVLTPKKVMDFAFLLKKINTDGVSWFDSETNEKIGCVTDHRFAAVFEIGRLMVKSECTAKIYMKKT